MISNYIYNFDYHTFMYNKVLLQSRDGKINYPEKIIVNQLPLNNGNDNSMFIFFLNNDNDN